MSNEFNNECENNCHNYALHNGIDIVLQKFSSAGISQSILSAAHQDSLERFTAYFNIKDYFIKLIGLDNYLAASKMENGRKWMASLPYHSNDVLLIGDTTHDYDVSKEIGCDCILIACGHQKADKLKSCNVSVYNSLMDLYNELCGQIVI